MNINLLPYYHTYITIVIILNYKSGYDIFDEFFFKKCQKKAQGNFWHKVIYKNGNEYDTHISLKVINIFKMILNLKRVFNCLLFIEDLSLLMKRIESIANILYLRGDINSIVSVMFVKDELWLRDEGSTTMSTIIDDICVNEIAFIISLFF